MIGSVRGVYQRSFQPVLSANLAECSVLSDVLHVVSRMTMVQVVRNTLLAFVLLAAAIPAARAEDPPQLYSAVPIPDGQIAMAISKLDGLVTDMMQRTGVPGIAVAVVADGKLSYAKGFGAREANKAGQSRPRHCVPDRLCFEVCRCDCGRSRGRGEEGQLEHAYYDFSTVVYAFRPPRDGHGDDWRLLRASFRSARPRG